MSPDILCPLIYLQSCLNLVIFEFPQLQCHAKNNPPYLPVKKPISEALFFVFSVTLNKLLFFLINLIFQLLKTQNINQQIFYFPTSSSNCFCSDSTVRPWVTHLKFLSLIFSIFLPTHSLILNNEKSILEVILDSYISHPTFRLLANSVHANFEKYSEFSYLLLHTHHCLLPEK